MLDPAAALPGAQAPFVNLPSPFTHPIAVETWDAFFRWREDGRLRDRTIDDTWARVANTVAAAEGGQATQWAQRWIHSLSRWQWLPDETLLRTAGTRIAPAPTPTLGAVLNLRAFVSPVAWPGMRRDLDTLAIGQVTTSVLRFLDDAVLAIPSYGAHGLQIGMLGIADALDDMGIDYDSRAALRVSQDAAAALAIGTLRGAIDLARERGGHPADPTRLEALRREGLQQSLVDGALQWGLRSHPVTIVAPAPRLARLANDASDAADPRARKQWPYAADGAMGLASPAAQLRLRLAIQPWIDVPIDYPLLLAAGADATDARDAGELARRNGLAPPVFRTLESVSAPVLPAIAAADALAGRHGG